MLGSFGVIEIIETDVLIFPQHSRFMAYEACICRDK
jgi:hypothetical protein